MNFAPVDLCAGFAAAGAAGGLLWLASHVRRARRVWKEIARKHQVRCPACGYDVRASVRRCPECGGPLPPW